MRAAHTTAMEEAASATAEKLFKDVQCVRETDILVQHQPLQGGFVCDR
jgi:hypothetical protein